MLNEKQMEMLKELVSADELLKQENSEKNKKIEELNEKINKLKEELNTKTEIIEKLNGHISQLDKIIKEQEILGNRFNEDKDSIIKMKDEEIANLNNSLQKMIENKNTENEIKTNQNIEYLTNTLNEQILKINELTQKNSDYENQLKEKENNLIKIENSYNVLNDKYNKDIN